MTALRFLCWGKTYLEEIILETPVIKWTARRFKPWKDCYVIKRTLYGSVSRGPKKNVRFPY